MNIIELLEKTLSSFSKEFIKSPYLCYTEHGLHARFYAQLISALPKEYLYTDVDNREICSIQKEYRTWNNLGKSKRQNWDIAVIDTASISSQGNIDHDYLPLFSVIEFGLNELLAHLVDDIDRLDHKDANISGKRFIAHFYRLSDKFTRRELSPKSKKILTVAKVKELLKYTKSKIDIYFGVSDITEDNSQGLWIINKDTITPLIAHNCARYE